DGIRHFHVTGVQTGALPIFKKPDWSRVKIPASPRINEIKDKLRKHKLASVCEEASCPNLGECFSNGTATFMIMGEICTRRCPFRSEERRVGTERRPPRARAR